MRGHSRTEPGQRTSNNEKEMADQAAFSKEKGCQAMQGKEKDVNIIIWPEPPQPEDSDDDPVDDWG
jgi:hypothetical protein